VARLLPIHKSEVQPGTTAAAAVRAARGCPGDCSPARYPRSSGSACPGSRLSLPLVRPVALDTRTAPRCPPPPLYSQRPSAALHLCRQNPIPTLPRLEHPARALQQLRESPAGAPEAVLRRVWACFGHQGTSPAGPAAASMRPPRHSPAGSFLYRHGRDAGVGNWRKQSCRAVRKLPCTAFRHCFNP
jgi:hypothetical protein